VNVQQVKLIETVGDLAETVLNVILQRSARGSATNPARHRRDEEGDWPSSPTAR